VQWQSLSRHAEVVIARVSIVHYEFDSLLRTSFRRALDAENPIGDDANTRTSV